MATMASRSAATTTRTAPVWQAMADLTPQSASRYAWWIWCTLLLAPFLLFLFVAYRLTNEMSGPRNEVWANYWFIGTMAYLAVATPLAIFWRSRAFAPYWRGEPVPPADYLKGNIPVWLVLELGGILALVGCLMTGSLLPCMLPAVAAFMFFVPLWPSGSAMVRQDGNTDDHAHYEEPR